MKNLKFSIPGVIAIAIALVVSSCCRERTIKKWQESQHSDLEKKIEELQNEPYIKLNTDSPIGVIETFDPETLEETDSTYNHR